MDDAPENVIFLNRLARLVKKFRDRAYRDSYVRSHTKQFLARQMRAFRGEKSQKDFAKELGMSQSVVSERLENPNYGKWNLQTLFDIAAKLDVAVFVRFVDFGTFLNLTNNMSETAVRPAEYSQAVINKAVYYQNSAEQSSFPFNIFVGHQVTISFLSKLDTKTNIELPKFESGGDKVMLDYTPPNLLSNFSRNRPYGLLS